MGDAMTAQSKCGQMQMFGHPTPIAIAASLPQQRFRVTLERHKVKHPYGTPDKRGKYEYEKLNEELEKLPAPLRECFDYVTIELPEVAGKQFLKCFKMFMGLGNADLMDFDESRGRL